MKDVMKEFKNRCFGNGVGKEFYAEYHDNEWGVPVHDDRLLFEMLILEGAQAGLSWETILKRRKNYKEAFYDFNVKKVSNMTDEQLDDLHKNSNIIRNRLKIYSTRKNALAFLKIQQEFGSFDKYIWAFVNHKPIVSKSRVFQSKSVISDKISKDLKKRGMNFVGSTIIYAYMQAIGMVNDHLIDCWLNNIKG